MSPISVIKSSAAKLSPALAIVVDHILMAGKIEILF
jgi:hypothetical protein